MAKSSILNSTLTVSKQSQAFLAPHHFSRLPRSCQVRHAGGHHGVADHDGQAAVLRGAHGAELEAVAAEGEGRRAVTVFNVGLDVHGRTAAGLLETRLKF